MGIIHVIKNASKRRMIIAFWDTKPKLLRKNNNLKHIIDVRALGEKKDISYNDGTITKDKLWIGLCHIKETDDLGYFGYFKNNKFYEIDRGFKVSNGPAINEKKNKLYFSDSFNSSIYEYT